MYISHFHNCKRFSTLLTRLTKRNLLVFILNVPINYYLARMFYLLLKPLQRKNDDDMVDDKE